MHDLLVIGGGINGAGIARDAAGRGLKVVLCEKDDLAAHTSSASTKLIHGGLRYLEMYDFALVRKALIEREILLRAAPHIIWPMRFVLPYDRDLRPAWLREEFRLAFEYSDCWVEDSRLVVLNAVDAQERGAEILTQTACVGLARHADHWEATLRGPDGEKTVMARAVVNAAGGWVDEILGLAEPGTRQQNLRLVKGSHIIVPRWHEGDYAYFFQNGDGRIMFAIPYERGEFTLIGTTDVPYEANKDKVEISQDEIDYLCAGASEYYKRSITPADVVATYSGVRPLYDDHAANASKVTRDYVLNCDRTGGAPVLSVFGGKITTYRELAEHALKELGPDFPGMAKPWTKSASLPGGDIPGADFEDFLRGLSLRHPWMEQRLLRRLARAYGTRVDALLGTAKSTVELGRDFGGGLHEAEVTYLMRHEFAQTAEDILWRRSKLRLHLTESEQASLAKWLGDRARD